VLVLFATNLVGLVPIGLPAPIADRLASAQGEGLLGHFLTGAFATLLATPCSAPFLGTAIGYALSRGPVEILAVFTLLGFGLALPYLAVALWPGLATRLPRPGPWMRWLERGLALALTASALWLASVLVSEAGLSAGLAALAAIVAAVALLALLPRRIAVPAALVLAAAALILPDRLAPLPGERPAAVADADWQVFDRKALGSLVRDGKVVLVDVTADWCLTCQVNKRLVLSSPGIRDRLAQPGVVRLRADWTRPDPAIADYLASHGRYGIPFNAVYGPGAPDGVLLPELLTEEAVIQALERAGPPKLAAVKG
jgi:suppressor for copper-sensitivity B